MGMREAPPSERSFEHDVDWPVGDGNWVKSSDNERHWTGIIQYRVYRNPTTWMKVYDYIVEIETDFEQYGYKFTDGEPDTYSLECTNRGKHEVKYNSGSAGIRKLYGWRLQPVNEWSN